MEVCIEIRNSSAWIYYGPILYALDIPYVESEHQPPNWTDRKLLSDDYVHPKARDHMLEPTVPWQYAINPGNVVVQEKKLKNGKLPSPIFARDNPPMSLSVDTWEISWPVVKDTADLPSISPVVGKKKKTKIKLIPYRSSKLHIAQFPIAKFEE